MDDLADRCREILEWDATGLIRGSKLRAYADSLVSISKRYRMKLAREKTVDDALRFVIETQMRGNRVTTFDEIGFTREQWWKLPTSIRKRWWSETNYGESQPSDELKSTIRAALEQ